MSEPAAWNKEAPSDDWDKMWNAIRCAIVNNNYPGSITYDPLQREIPNKVSGMMMLNSVLDAVNGEPQS